MMLVTDWVRESLQVFDLERVFHCPSQAAITPLQRY